MYRTALSFGAIFAGLGVVLGAFGAHALKAVMAPEQLASFETGVRYQMYHAFALIATGIIYAYFPHSQVKWASNFFIAGIIAFSGSIYALTLLKTKGVVGLTGLGIITPIGGLLFILGWIMLLLGVSREHS